MARAERPDDDLEAAAFHVAYEVTMLHVATDRAAIEMAKHQQPVSRTHTVGTSMTTTASYVWSLTLGAGDDFLRNAFVEVALLHARNVSEFLFPRGGRGESNQVQAVDFLPVWDSHPKRIKIAGQSLDRLRGRIDQHLSHITYARVRDADPEWSIAISRDLLEQFELFFKQLPEERRTWFGPGVNEFFSL